MNNKLVGIVVALIIVVGVGFFAVTPRGADEEAQVVFDPRNATYQIGEDSVTLINGEAEIQGAPNSMSKIVTRYFGNDARGDLNADGNEDMAFLLTQNMGGSGTFYYVVAVLNTQADNAERTNVVVIGDRIAPQTTEIRDGEIIVNYADRQFGEPMTAEPSLGVSRYFKVTGTQLSEVQK